jgi:hypothetical protein
MSWPTRTRAATVKGADKELVMYGWVRGVSANHFATLAMDEAIAYRYGLMTSTTSSTTRRPPGRTTGATS